MAAAHDRLNVRRATIIQQKSGQRILVGGPAASLIQLGQPLEQKQAQIVRKVTRNYPNAHNRFKPENRNGAICINL